MNIKNTKLKYIYLDEIRFPTFRNGVGQVAVMLLLIMLAALMVGLAITQRSITDVSTSTQTEQASRAFSAAEAGIERAFSNPPIAGCTAPCVTVQESELGNQSSAKVSVANDLPRSDQALEYPPVGRETIAQFWLADPDNLTSYYNQNNVDVYFGQDNSNISELPALEINLITRNSAGVYQSYKSFYDTNNNRTTTNGFTVCPSLNRSSPFKINTTNSVSYPTPLDRPFICWVTLSNINNGGEVPILIRARILYSSTNQPIAVKPTSNGSLPPQATIYTSTGTSGLTQKVIQVFKLRNVVPSLFDFAIFSAGDIVKQ